MSAESPYFENVWVKTPAAFKTVLGPQDEECLRVQEGNSKWSFVYAGLLTVHYLGEKVTTELVQFSNVSKMTISSIYKP